MRLGTDFRPLRPAARWVHGGARDAEHPRRKPELLHFFSLSSEALGEDLPRISEWAHEFGDQLKVVGVHTPVEVADMDPDRVVEEVDRYGLDYPVALDGDDGALADKYDVRVTPSYYLFDEDGHLRHYHAGAEGAESVEHALEELVRSERPN